VQIGHIYRLTPKFQAALCKRFQLRSDWDYVACVVKYSKETSSYAIMVSCHSCAATAIHCTTNVPDVTANFDSLKIVHCQLHNLQLTHYCVSNESLKSLVAAYDTWWKTQAYVFAKLQIKQISATRYSIPATCRMSNRSVNSEREKPNMKNVYIPPLPYKKPSFWIYSNHWQGGAPQ